ncbi:hypothetical protein [Xenorhabdus bovienii]|uniref:hypothetical protein n=1 Tax=Xenorhabdus bovienii TaxID=40576 RepID=UPI0023B3114A|nr:hypothetical protein [Xenorhabdus bovienii]MDE9460832.1 hypothetical protein [Xenorhabdus bovienii]MDE9468118.1 hypothetical protein [Xenorhabdus bovienii]
MNDYTEITTKFCEPNINLVSDINSCNDVILKLPKSEMNKLQSSIISSNPPLNEINANIFMAGFGLVLFFYLLGFGVGQARKMFNL